MDDTPKPPPAATKIDSRSGFHDAVRNALAEAAHTGCRELLLADADFADWPLGETAVVESLTHWARPHRRLTLLARHFDHVVRVHPRWVAWRRTWAHVVDCRVPDEADADQVPTLLLAPGLVGLHIVDPRLWRGRLSHDAADLRVWADATDAVLQRSSPSFPSTTLGL